MNLKLAFITKLIKQYFRGKIRNKRELFNEMEDRQQNEMRRAVAAGITEHVQPLGITIHKERGERVQVVAEIQEQRIGLRDEFQAFASTSGCRARDACADDVRTDEIVIG